MAGAIYRPLDNTIQEIRVLRVLPGKTGLFDEALACTFEYVSLADKPDFAALSYTWGDDLYDEAYSDSGHTSSELSNSLKDSSSEPNTVDGVPVKIGRNLLDALKYFRSEAKAKPIQRESLQKPRFTSRTRLWADALCINQDDLVERSQQVSQMHQIYKKASRVLVWPGISHLKGQRELSEFIDSFEDDHLNTAQKLLRPHNPKLIAVLHNPLFDDCWKALEDINKCRYWNRLWIVQEVLSNSETWVYIGEELIQLLPLLSMGLALQYLDDSEIQSFPPYTRSIVESVKIPLNLPLLDGKLQFSGPAAKPMELLDLLQTFRKFECRDPRDKVYALAGLSTQYQKELVIDYSKDVTEIYKDVARLIVETTQRLEIICTDEKTTCNCPQGSHQKPSSLPTWVPNWSCIREGVGVRPGLLRGRTWDQFHQWNASGDMSIDAHISDDGSVLKCKGILLGTITHIVRPEADNGPRDFHNILRLLRTTHSLDDSNQIALYTALRETLLKTGYIDESVSRELPLPSFLRICELSPNFHFIAQERDKELVDKFYYYLGMAMEDRCFYTGVTSEEGREQSVIGVTFPFSMERDVLAVLYGCRWPILLRRRRSEEGDGFVVLGEVYVNGFMNGEGLELGIGETMFEIY